MSNKKKCKTCCDISSHYKSRHSKNILRNQYSRYRLRDRTKRIPFAMSERPVPEILLPSPWGCQSKTRSSSRIITLGVSELLSGNTHVWALSSGSHPSRDSRRERRRRGRRVGSSRDPQEHATATLRSGEQPASQPPCHTMEYWYVNIAATVARRWRWRWRRRRQWRWRPCSSG